VGDPAATAGQAQDPVDFLIELGTPPRAARFFVPILRGAVTDAVCALLPKAGTDVPAQWLMATSLVQVQLTPGLIYDLEPSLSTVHVAAGTLPGQMMYPVWYELNARAQQQPSVRGTAPAPSKELLAFRKSAERTASDLFGAYFGRGQAQEGLATLSEGSAKAAAGLDHSGQPAWGGWVTLAAVLAIQSDPTLPRPGLARRRWPWQAAVAQGAGLGLQIGESFAMATALGLLKQAEGTAR
jgi:hypothetical protein